MSSAPVSPSPAAPVAAEEGWSHVARLRCAVEIVVPVPKFTVRDLLRLEAGSVVVSGWKLGSNLPLLVKGQQIGWVELEGLGGAVVARITELL